MIRALRCTEGQGMDNVVWGLVCVLGAAALLLYGERKSSPWHGLPTCWLIGCVYGQSTAVPSKEWNKPYSLRIVWYSKHCGACPSSSSHDNHWKMYCVVWDKPDCYLSDCVLFVCSRADISAVYAGLSDLLLCVLSPCVLWQSLWSPGNVLLQTWAVICCTWCKVKVFDPKQWSFIIR